MVVYLLGACCLLRSDPVSAGPERNLHDAENPSNAWTAPVADESSSRAIPAVHGHYAHTLDASVAASELKLPRLARAHSFPTPTPLGSAIAPSAVSRLSLRELLRDEGPRREVTFRFVHSVVNLSNNPVFGVDVAIAIPGDDVHQRVHSVTFRPAPEKTRVNGWRQQTALFHIDELAARGRLDIYATVRVSLRDVQWNITERDVGGYDEIPPSILRQYLRDGKKYRLSDPRLIAAARSLRATDNDGVLEQIRRIHDYVIDQLRYERDDTWDSASQVLERGTGSCSEYVYLMIALCRLSGIPARYAGGSWLDDPAGALPHVDRVFHRWVEIYLPRIGWYPIDPTENDKHDQVGQHYSYFGRIPWSYLTMAKGDGDELESGALGWDYRSNCRWIPPRTGSVVVERYAIWLDGTAPTLAQNGRLAPLLRTSFR